MQNELEHHQPQGLFLIYLIHLSILSIYSGCAKSSPLWHPPVLEALTLVSSRANFCHEDSPPASSEYFVLPNQPHYNWKVRFHELTSLSCAIGQVWCLNWSHADAVHQLLYLLPLSVWNLPFLSAWLAGSLRPSNLTSSSCSVWRRLNANHF